jgi:hypothetical protein
MSERLAVVRHNYCHVRDAADGTGTMGDLSQVKASMHNIVRSIRISLCYSHIRMLSVGKKVRDDHVIQLERD